MIQHLASFTHIASFYLKWECLVHLLNHYLDSSKGKREGISSVLLLSHVWLFATPWTAAYQGSLSITNSRACSNSCPLNWWCHPTIVLCHPLLLLPSILPSIRVFSDESVLCIRWPKYLRFSFGISPFNEYSGLISLGWTGWISLQSKGLSRVFSNTTVQKHQFFNAQFSL